MKGNLGHSERVLICLYVHFGVPEYRRRERCAYSADKDGGLVMKTTG
ncbi:MAG: hypothetical protein SFY80_17745 [Verrucomicrobiota bacterium]|nr:hypothetical protein [Verrucomicrobiota bacterium]